VNTGFRDVENPWTGDGRLAPCVAPQQRSQPPSRRAGRMNARLIESPPARRLTRKTQFFNRAT